MDGIGIWTHLCTLQYPRQLKSCTSAGFTFKSCTSANPNAIHFHASPHAHIPNPYKKYDNYILFNDKTYLFNDKTDLFNDKTYLFNDKSNPALVQDFAKITKQTRTILRTLKQVEKKDWLTSTLYIDCAIASKPVFLLHISGFLYVDCGTKRIWKNGTTWNQQNQSRNMAKMMSFSDLHNSFHIHLFCRMFVIYF